MALAIRAWSDGSTKAWCVHIARELVTLLRTILPMLGISNGGVTDPGLTRKVAGATIVEGRMAVVVREAEVMLVLTLSREAQ